MKNVHFHIMRNTNWSFTKFLFLTYQIDKNNESFALYSVNEATEKQHSRIIGGKMKLYNSSGNLAILYVVYWN